MTQVEIENVGPIKALRFELPPGGGVLVLEGENGAGKTTTIRTLSGEYDSLTPRDGTIAGTARIGTLELTIGQKVTERGTLTVNRLQADADPSVLVDPGFKDPEVNDLRRVLTLCTLAGIEPSLALFEAELGKPAGVSLRALVGDDALAAKSIPELAKHVKSALEKASRSREGEASSLRARAGGLAAAMEGVGDTEPHDADALAHATEEAVRAKADLDARYRSASDALQLQANARAQLERVGAGLTVEQARARLDEKRSAWAELNAESLKRGEVLEDQIRAAGAQEQLAEQAVRDLEQQLVSARATYSSRQEFRIGVDRKLQELKLSMVADARVMQKQIEQHEADLGSAAASEAGLANLRQIVDKPLPVAPEQSDLAAAELRLSAARKAQERGAVVREARKRQAEALGLLKQADEEATAGVALRDASQAVWQVVENAVEKVKPRGLRLVGGRVVFMHPERGEVYFAELSNGERWRVALDAAIDAVGTDGLIGIQQEAWEGLDPDNRAAIAAHCRERGAVVITAMASAGELRATVVQ